MRPGSARVTGRRRIPRPAAGTRVCEANAHEEYPRTDPAVICLVHDGVDRVLIARQPVWPAGRFSVLAGFVEAGESLEACVARELHEEVGAEVTEIRYLGSQAWPFPRSLMIGFHALADPEVPLRRPTARSPRPCGSPGPTSAPPWPTATGAPGPRCCSRAASPSPAPCWSPGPPCRAAPPARARGAQAASAARVDRTWTRVGLVAVEPSG